MLQLTVDADVVMVDCMPFVESLRDWRVMDPSISVRLIVKVGLHVMSLLLWLLKMKLKLRIVLLLQMK
jgi:hypothetical protein